jgi:hypothetical protein
MRGNVFSRRTGEWVSRLATFAGWHVTAAGIRGETWAPRGSGLQE